MQGHKVLMVCSAFSKVSDTLEKLVESAQLVEMPVSL